MRTLVLSDIHANLVALEAVLKDAAGHWDQIWFLGDLVGYGPNPNECIDRLRDLEPAVTLSGNHDWAVLDKLSTEEFNNDARWAVDWTRRQLTEENHAYLTGLPPLHIAPPFTMAHASPRHPIWEYILDAQTAWENFESFATPICLVGHSHIPLLFLLNGPLDVPEPYLVTDGDTIEMDRGRMILNPGSVGQPRDGDPRASYALLDHEAHIWQLHRVQYDIAETQWQMAQHKMPSRLIERLEYGL